MKTKKPRFKFIMNIETDRKYKVINGRHEYFGRPESIILDMSWWDRSRPDSDPGRVSNNSQYIQLVLHRLFVEESEMTDINDECKLLSFLDDEDLIEIVESD